MSAYRPGRAPSTVHASLVRSLEVAEAATGQALLRFGEVLHRTLYRPLGYLTIQTYAAAELGFSAKKAEQFVQLARLVRRYPRLRRSLERGKLTWTQVRTVAPILTEASEAHWVARAEALSRRELSEEIRRARAAQRAEVATPTQVPLSPGEGAIEPGRVPAPTATPNPPGDTGPAPEPAPSTLASAPGSTVAPSPAPAATPPPAGPRSDEVMCSVTLRFRPLDRARLERLVESLRRSGHRGDREALILDALEKLAAAPGAHRATDGADGACGTDNTNSTDGTDSTDGPGSCTADPPSPSIGTRPAHQVVVTLCPSRRSASTGVGAGIRPVDPITLDALLCDADVVDERGHRRSTIPPSTRRRVLARDRHRCATPGCGSTRHLEIHHRGPVSRGGTNEIGNLITVCRSCHRSIHDRRLCLSPRAPVRDAAVLDEAPAPG